MQAWASKYFDSNITSVRSTAGLLLAGALFHYRFVKTYILFDVYARLQHSVSGFVFVVCMCVIGLSVKYMVELWFKSCDDDLNEFLRLHCVCDLQMVKYIQFVVSFHEIISKCFAKQWVV